MSSVMGVIYTGDGDARLSELSTTRAIAALPVLGRYRVIDFLVSSFVNSGVHNIGIIMQKNYHSLMDHLGSGKEWDLHGKNTGLFILPPFLTRENIGVYTGLIDALRSNTSYLTRSKQDYVILSDSTIVFATQFREMLEAHINSHAEITLMYTKDHSMLRSGYGAYLSLDSNGKVTSVEIEPFDTAGKSLFMRVMLLKRDFLLKLINEAGAYGYHDMERDILQRFIQNDSIQVTGYEYEGLCWQIDSISSYFQMNMAFLDPDLRKSFFTDELPIYTKVRDEMPAMYKNTGSSSRSLVADGCIIEGQVSDSVLFRGVKVMEGAQVNRCIIMQDGLINSGAYIENCILDKQVIIKRKAKLIGPEAYPIVIGKNVVI